MVSPIANNSTMRIVQQTESDREELRNLEQKMLEESGTAVRCHWCLEWFVEKDQPHTDQELGFLKTKLSIPDSHHPVICNNCFKKQMDEGDTFGRNPMYKVNRLLLGI